MSRTDDLPQWAVEMRTSLSMQAVFFASLMYRETRLVVLPADNPQCRTAATDGRVIYFNEEFCQTKLANVGERVFVIAHELLHVMGRHAQRMQTYAREGLCGRPFYPELYNWCADAVINKQLVECKVGRMPSMGVMHPDIGADELIEDVYARFLKKVPKENDQRGGGQGQGGGQDQGQGQSGGGGDASTAETSPGRTAAQDGFSGSQHDQMHAPTSDAPSEQDMRGAVASASQAAKAAGDLPATLKRLIGEVLEPKVDWAVKVQHFLTVLAKGNERVDWSRPNRRRLAFPGIYTPRRKGMRLGTVVWGIDVSGSMSDPEITALFSECVAFLSQVTVDRMVVIWCDAQIGRVDEIDDVNDLLDLRKASAPGGGGTRFEPVFKWCEDNLDDAPDVVLYGTDMYPMGWPEDPGYPVLWVSTTPRLEGPFGETVHLTL